MWYLLAVRILRKLKKVIGELIAYVCRFHNVNVDYVFKGINDIPGELPVRRTKQGNCLCCLNAKKVFNIVFIAINADDYYGKTDFKVVYECRVNVGKSCITDFVLRYILLDNGGVTRGICNIYENGNRTTQIASITANIDALKAELKNGEKEVATKEEQKAMADAKKT